MNATVTPPARTTIKAMQVQIVGRIESMSRYEGKYKTHVLTPAADAYSRPQLVEIRSKGKLGEKQEEISQLCQLGGYARKAFRAVDKDTGETSMVTPVEHTLDAVE